MQHQQRLKEAQAHFDSHAEDYRRFDEDTVEEDSPRHTCARLRELTRSFARKICVLDLGCGCGRSFHCLENVERLVGMDFSLPMLQQARRPVYTERVKVGKLTLVCADFFKIVLPREYFDFVYSIGMLGEHTPFHAEACHKLYDALKPGGLLFFTVIDRAAMPEPKGLKRRLAESVYPVLPGPLKEKWRERWRSFYLLESELRAIMDAGPFSRYEISRHECNSARWQGAHFECTAYK